METDKWFGTTIPPLRKSNTLYAKYAKKPKNCASGVKTPPFHMRFLRKVLNDAT